jgi:DnaJ family protein C protein 27
LQFVSKYISTIGVDYGVKGIVLAGEEVKVNFWDLAGSKEYLEVRNEFYKDTQGCLLVRSKLRAACLSNRALSIVCQVFDVSSKKSFDNLEAWLKEAKQ